MHPLITNLSEMKDAEIEAKITDLGKKYFMTQNFGLQQQISAVLETYKEEMATRRHNEWQRMMENREKGLDKLININ
jgi:hypothetical protein